MYTSLLGRRGVEEPLHATSSIYLASSVFALPLFVVEGFGELDVTSVLSLLGLIALPTLLGHTSVVVASGHVKPHVIETIGLLEPVVVASALAFLLLGQVPSLYQLIGGGIVVMSVAVVVVEGRK
ncbi:MAG: EamA family transporter [Candidatus Aramenus sp.]|nr:EamA family transporter [Candidatus Aramenus sp.]